MFAFRNAIRTYMRLLDELPRLPRFSLGGGRVENVPQPCLRTKTAHKSQLIQIPMGDV